MFLFKNVPLLLIACMFASLANCKMVAQFPSSRTGRSNENDLIGQGLIDMKIGNLDNNQVEPLTGQVALVGGLVLRLWSTGQPVCHALQSYLSFQKSCSF